MSPVHLVLDRVHQLHCPSDLRAVRFGPLKETVIVGCQFALTQIQEFQLMQNIAKHTVWLDNIEKDVKNDVDQRLKLSATKHGYGKG